MSEWPRSHRKEPIRFLSVQSHVTRDYVGNSAAVPLLQALGIHVDAVNTCDFSSLYIHSGSMNNAITDILDGLVIGFRNNKGGGFPGSSVKGLSKSDFSDYSVILSGFSSSPDQLEELSKHLPILFNQMNKERAIYICDPVLGDWDHLYVPKIMVSKYNDLIKNATYITPNHYELQWLAYGYEAGYNTRVIDEVSCIRACEVLSKTFDAEKTKAIIVTSCPSATEGLLFTCVYHLEPERYAYLMYYKHRDIKLSGTGDTFTACLGAQLYNARSELGNGDLIDDCVLRSTALTQAVIDVSQESVNYATYTDQWPCVNVLGDTCEEIRFSMNIVPSNLSSTDSRFAKHYISMKETNTIIKDPGTYH